MTKPKKTKATATERRAAVQDALRLVQNAVRNYQSDHKNWHLEVIFSLITWGLKNLRVFLDGAPKSKQQVPWEHPFVTVNYPVDWDWGAAKQRGEEYGRVLCGKVTHQSLSEKPTARNELTKLLVSILTCSALGDLTNHVRLSKRGDAYRAYLPSPVVEYLESISSKTKRDGLFNQIIRPFSIGAASIDLDLDALRDRQSIPKKAAKQLRNISNLIDIRGIRLSGDVNEHKIDMSLIFQIHPLVTDIELERAYYPLTVGLFVEPKITRRGILIDGPGKWSAKDRDQFWKQLFQQLDERIRGLFPKDSAQYLILNVNSQLKVSRSDWTEDPAGITKKVTEALSLAGQISQLNFETSENSVVSGSSCTICGMVHDPMFMRIALPSGEVFDLTGVLSDIVQCVHLAHERGEVRLFIKNDELVKVCGGYRFPSKAFYDLGQATAFKALFDTSKNSYIRLRSAIVTGRNTS